MRSSELNKKEISPPDVVELAMHCCAVGKHKPSLIYRHHIANLSTIILYADCVLG